VDECIVRGLLVGQGVALGFRHELVRDAVESALPLGRRRSAHAAVLAHLEGDARTGRRSFGGTERRERLSALAHHATEAGDDQAVLRYATAAGILALKYQANREALIQLRRAARLAELLPV